MRKPIRNISKLFLAALAVICTLGPVAASAQAIFGLEGPIERVLPGQNAMVVMRSRVSVPPGTPIVTPTGPLAGLAALIGAPLPGRIAADGVTPIPGFIGGTAIINGTIDATGTLVATDVFAEPAENVTIGTITAATCLNARCTGAGSSLRLNGAIMKPILDPRLAAGPVTNDFGFAVNLTGANLVGAAASAEGYFAGGRFNYFLLTVDPAAAPLARAGAEVSITRAQCRADAGGIQLDVLGNTHPQAGSINITNGAGTTFGTQALIASGVPGFGAYTFRLRNNVAFQTCPANVTAVFGAVTATSAVDIIP